MKKFKLNFDFIKYITPFNLVLVAIIATTLYLGYVTFQTRSTLNQITQAAPGHKVQLAEKPANLTVTLFYDYQCPFCFQIDPLVREAAAKDGEVELVFKFLPFFGERSEQMGYMAYAGGQQDKFLDVHDYFIKGGNREYDEEEIRLMTQSLNLDHDKFVKDMNSTAAKNKIQNNMDLAMSLNVYSTPTLYMARDFFSPTGEMPDVDGFIKLFDEARQRL